MASTHADAADSQSDGSDSPILVERPGPSDVATAGELADREAAGGAAAGGSEAKADDSSAGPPGSDGALGDAREERAEPPGQVEAASAAALVAPSKAQERERVAAGGSAQGEVAAAVGQVAAGVAAGVAGLASSAGAEAAAVVSSLGERVTGLSTGFVSLFSVFDSAIAYPSDNPTAPAGAAGSTAQAEAVKARGGDGRGAGGAEEEGQAGGEGGVRSPHPSRAIDLQAIFGLPTHETLLEAFPCRLLQLYRPVHNTFTPDMRRAFRGTLYITHQHVCLCLDDSGRRIPIKLEAGEVAGVGKQVARRGDTSDQLKIDLHGVHNSLLLQDFASPDALDSALALLEHITS